MLKIKDNVDLEELKKYGFHKAFDDYIITNNDYIITIYENRCGDYVNIFCFGVDRTIFFNISGDFQELINVNLNVLYDLIQDGLVEKVDE